MVHTEKCPELMILNVDVCRYSVFDGDEAYLQVQMINLQKGLPSVIHRWQALSFFMRWSLQ